MLGERGVGDTDLRPRALPRDKSRPAEVGFGHPTRPPSEHAAGQATASQAASQAVASARRPAAGLGRGLTPSERPRAAGALPAAEGHDEGVDAASPHRGWLALTLNGMADFDPEAYQGVSGSSVGTSRGEVGSATGWHACAGRTCIGHQRPHGIGSAAGLPCHVCFRPSVDIVIPPPARTVDVPGCRELLSLSRSLEQLSPLPKPVMGLAIGAWLPALMPRGGSTVSGGSTALPQATPPRVPFAAPLPTFSSPPPNRPCPFSSAPAGRPRREQAES